MPDPTQPPEDIIWPERFRESLFDRTTSETWHKFMWGGFAADVPPITKAPSIHVRNELYRTLVETDEVFATDPWAEGSDEAPRLIQTEMRPLVLVEQRGVIPATPGSAVGIPDRRKRDLLLKMAKTLNVGDRVTVHVPADPVCCGSRMVWQLSACQWYCPECNRTQACRSLEPIPRAVGKVLPFGKKP